MRYSFPQYVHAFWCRSLATSHPPSVSTPGMKAFLHFIRKARILFLQFTKLRSIDLKKACRIMIVMIWLFAAYESSTSRLFKAKVLDYMQKSGCLWQVPLPNRGMNAGEYDGLDGLKCTILLVVVLLASEEGQAFLVSSLLLAGSCSLPSGRLLLPHDIMVNGRKSHVGWRLKTWWGS